MTPFYFGLGKIPRVTNKELLAAIDEVRREKSQDEAIEKAMRLIAGKYKSGRFRTYILFWKALEKDPNKLWQRSGFMHCMQQNFLVRVLLTESGWVKKKDFSLGYCLVWYISPHEYVIVHQGKKRLALDPWNFNYGARVGEYAAGFGTKRLD